MSDKYDLSEEIARIYGYDNIKPESFKSDMSGGGYTDKQKFEIKLNDVFKGFRALTKFIPILYGNKIF